MAKLTVVLNGTKVNPYLSMGLSQNPFPQLGQKETVEYELRLAKLGADPIPHDDYKEYIRKILDGFSEELIQLCITKFRPDQLVEFQVYWRD